MGAPKKITFNGATYVRTSAAREEVEEGFKNVHHDFKAISDARMDMYHAYQSLISRLKEMGYWRLAQEVKYRHDTNHKKDYDQFRDLQRRLEEQIGKDLGARVVINW
jgi:hypothetical protein